MSQRYIRKLHIESHGVLSYRLLYPEKCAVSRKSGAFPWLNGPPSIRYVRRWPGEGHVWSETAPAALGDGASGEDMAAQGIGECGQGKERQLHTRLLQRRPTASKVTLYLVAYSITSRTSACPDRERGFGDGRKAVLALESKYRVDSTFPMQELHYQFSSLAVRAVDSFDLARVIQEVRRTELEALGNKVVT